MSGFGEIEDSARDEQEPRPDLEALEDARSEKGPLPLAAPSEPSGNDMAAANRRDMETERRCRETAQALTELASGPFEGRVACGLLGEVARVLEAEADHIVAVWD